MTRTIIEFRVSKPEDMRYKTVGDWRYDPDNKEKLIVECVDMGNKKMNLCLLMHELVESVLCEARHISQEAVDVFDLAHEEEQFGTEIGDLDEAPYHWEHMAASIIEQIMCQEFKLSWQEYNRKIEEEFIIVSNELDDKREGTEE